MDNSNRPRRLAALLVFASGGLVTGAWAASPSEPAVVANQLEEITVTAQKREQSLNDVGLSVSALSGDFLKNQHIVTLEDLAHTVPSLTFANTSSGAPTITLRGVGYNETSLAASPTVSLYVDQVSLPFPVMASHTIFDLERVEVLKGPQGTTFGQNATGGAINFIAAKPTREFAAGVSLTYGNFNSIQQEAYVSGPLSDTVSARLAERTETADGWQQSVSRPGDTNGAVRTSAVRLLVDYRPTDNAKFEVNLNTWSDTGQSQAGQYIGRDIQHPGGAPGALPGAPNYYKYTDPIVLSEPFAAANDRSADWNSGLPGKGAGLPSKDNKFSQISLRGDIGLAHDLTLTTITGLSVFDQNEADDYDGLPVSVSDWKKNLGSIHDFSQELRIANAGNGGWRWLVGANYQKSSVDQHFLYNYGNSSSTYSLGVPASPGVPAIGYPIFESYFGTAQQMKTVAVFANTEYALSNAFTLKAGVRYTRSQTDNASCGTDISPPYYAGKLFYDAILGGAYGPFVPGDCYPLNNIRAGFAGVPFFGPGVFRDTLTQHNVPWTVGLDWKPRDRALVYANITQGFKSGSFPTGGAALWSQLLPVTQESLRSYEVGFKLTSEDRKTQVNGATFYYDYKDKQLAARTIDPIFGALQQLFNIPKSSAKGVELELMTRPVTGFTLSIGGSWIEATIDKFSGVSATGITANFAGTPMPFTPKISVNLDAEYRFPLGTRTAFIGARDTYRSSTISVIGGDKNSPKAEPQDKLLFGIDAFSLLDIRAGIEGDQWRATLWGKNVTNKYYWNSVAPAFDTIVRYAGMPATYGISLTYKFNNQ